MPKNNRGKEHFKQQESTELTLLDTTNNLLSKINEDTDPDTIKNLTKLFNLNLAKKNMLRVAKESELLDLIIHQASERLSKRPDEISNKELIDYLNALQNSVDKGQKNINSIDEMPMIQINQNKNEVNVNVQNETLDRDSRERIMNVVKLILNQQDKSINDISNEVKEIKDE